MPPQPAASEFVPGEALVRWRADAPDSAIATALAGVSAGRISSIASMRLDRLRVPIGQEWNVIERLRADPRVLYAEPNYIAHAAFVPNDPSYATQWNLAQVSAPAAWDLARGSGDIKIAVIDSGVDMNHPDLDMSHRMIYGYDYIHDDPTPDDEFGHGTHVTGILGAVTNNEAGVAGMAWYGQFLIYKVLDAYGGGTYADIVAAIESARDNGARIINLSLEGDQPSASLQDAVTRAYDAGILLVASTGNHNGPVRYPAAYPSVIAVAATTNLDRYAWYSNFGPEVDVAAPGGLVEAQIYSTLRSSSYGYQYGTSMSAPHVAGLAALIWSLDPTLTNDQVRQILLDTADKVDASSHPYVNGRNNYLGYGRINADLATHTATPPVLVASSQDLNITLPTDHPTATSTITLTNPSLRWLNWQAQVQASNAWLALSPPISGSLVYPNVGSLTMHITATAMIPGVYWGLVVLGTDRDQSMNIWVQLRIFRPAARIYLPSVRRSP
jgi:thermitase